MKCLFQTITVTTKFGFEQYTNKNTIEDHFCCIKKRKHKDKVSYMKRLAKMECYFLKATQN